MMMMSVRIEVDEDGNPKAKHNLPPEQLWTLLSACNSGQELRTKGQDKDPGVRRAVVRALAKKGLLELSKVVSADDEGGYIMTSSAVELMTACGYMDESLHEVFQLTARGVTEFRSLRGVR